MSGPARQRDFVDREGRDVEMPVEQRRRVPLQRQAADPQPQVRGDDAQRIDPQRPGETAGRVLDDELPAAQASDGVGGKAQAGFGAHQPRRKQRRRHDEQQHEQQQSARDAEKPAPHRSLDCGRHRRSGSAEQ